MLSCHALVSKLTLPTFTQTSTCVFYFGLLRTRRLNFLYMSCFISTMKYSDVDVFNITSSPQIRKKITINIYILSGKIITGFLQIVSLDRKEIINTAVLGSS